jgi:hypothetical protein
VPEEIVFRLEPGRDPERLAPAELIQLAAQALGLSADAFAEARRSAFPSMRGRSP